jgi:hypothetical protein
MAEAGRLTVDAEALVVETCTLLRDVLPRLADLGPQWGSTRAIVAGAVDAHRALLARWARIPEDYASQPIGPDGATSRHVLDAGLRSMGQWTSSLARAVAATDAAALLALGESITARYGVGWEPPPELTAGSDHDDDGVLPAWWQTLRRLAGLARQGLAGLSGEGLIILAVLVVALVALAVGGAR